ncbi:hypothetical protein GGR53DRAFT_287718 [Hypoxylon sp. FL1150]|nr:hypothetical protein GGR53DRAFT_287718 [Hypoxylon sp. FL1150]
MDTFAFATGALLGAARQMNTMFFGANYSSIVGSTAPSIVLDNATIVSPVFDASNVMTGPVVDVPITNVVVAMTSNGTSEREVDSGIEIDTVVTVASVRPQEITQESQTTGSTAAVGHSRASQAAATDAPDTTSTEHRVQF